MAELTRAAANFSRGAPVHIETEGFLLRSLQPADATQIFLNLLQSEPMLKGLNLPPLNMPLEQFRRMIAGTDSLNHHLIGIFPKHSNLPIGFYQLDVNLQHRAALLTGGIGAAPYLGKNIMSATAPAITEHFFTFRNLDKITVRVLANNRRALFNFWKNPGLFTPEGVLRRECVTQDGKRCDVIVFAAYRIPPASPKA